MEMVLSSGFETVALANLDEQELMMVSGGEFWEGLTHAIQGGALITTGAGTLNVLSTMTTTKVIPALLMTGGAVGASIAIACGVVAVGYGIYEMCN